jgi:hypothetical protein
MRYNYFMRKKKDLVLILDGGPIEEGFEYGLHHEVTEKRDGGYVSYTIRERAIHAIGPDKKNNFKLMMSGSSQPDSVNTRRITYGTAHGEKEAERRVYEDLLNWARIHGYKVSDETKFAGKENELKRNN